jgi:hypothetical protein
VLTQFIVRTPAAASQKSSLFGLFLSFARRKPLRIISLHHLVAQPTWNHILAQNGGGWVGLQATSQRPEQEVPVGSTGAQIPQPSETAAIVTNSCHAPGGLHSAGAANESGTKINAMIAAMRLALKLFVPMA